MGTTSESGSQVSSGGGSKTCPSCGKSVGELLRLDGDLKARISSDLGIKTPHESVCPNCYTEFGQKLAADAAKKSRRQAKEQHRLNLWRSRVNLIREARDRFALKDYPGAVVAYEKYFRVLEIIYEVKQNEIKPVHFNNSARSKELVVIASALWDLMRIYDQSPRFSKRLQQCADKLAEFLPFTPIFGEIIRKIDDYKKVARNKEIFDGVIKKAGKGKRRCFIATATYQNPDHPDVISLAHFRDEVLTRSVYGRGLVQVYYIVSPLIAEILDRSEFLRNQCRRVLSPLALFIAAKFNLKTK